jgi:hypothetical protein
VYLSIEYYDAGTSTLTLQYDAIGTDFSFYYKNGGSITLTNTNTWKSGTFHVTDAWFGNRQNAGADFRIGNVGNRFYLNRVWVTTDQPLPPVIDEVTPDPQIVSPGTPCGQQLQLLQGNPWPAWSVTPPAPPGLKISACGLVSGWTPGVEDIGDHIIVIAATNSEGSDTESWVVRVVSDKDFDQDGDVDQEDFGVFQHCLSGTGVSYGTGCAPADLDTNGAIDQTDFSLFWACMAGAGRPPGC